MTYSGITKIAILGLTVIGSSCATDVANRYYASEKFPEKDPSEVQILSSRPKQKFEVIADFQSRNESQESIQKRAAKIGADAVIITNLGGIYSFSEEWVNQDSQNGTGSRMIGTAIIFK
jgi:hypothetical protein